MSATNAGSETTKTLMFVGVAVLSLAVAFFTRPPKVSSKMDDEVGTVLFEELSDPAAASGLEVVSYNEELAELKRFKVEQQEKGIWVIPSYDKYPADAQDRLVSAATMFTDLEVIRVASENAADHATLGVLEPDADEINVGDEGVGTLVNVFGSGSKKLASLIIGKQVKGSDDQHFVRRPGKSRVYQVKIDPSQLSTKFEDWIETDLLKVSSWDVDSVTIRDYSMEARQTLQGYLVSEERRFDLKTSQKDNEWQLDSLTEYANNEPRPTQLEAGEELKKDRLDTLKNSLSELKIVDVERKPKGLGADLRADKSFTEDMENIASLASRGFYALQGEDGSVDLRSGDGELIVDTKDGVQYVLRFGKIAGLADTEEVDDEGEVKTESSLNRYMFVSVKLNEDKFPQPELQPLPEGADTLEAASDGEEKDDDSTEDDATETEADDEGEDEKKSDNELALQVEQIKKANQRLIDERNDKITAAKKKVAELKYRFADWYYVVPDDVFKKLRLRRDDVIAFSEEALKAGDGLAAFRSLQEEGVKPAEEESE